MNPRGDNHEGTYIPLRVGQRSPLRTQEARREDGGDGQRHHPIGAGHPLQGYLRRRGRAADGAVDGPRRHLHPKVAKSSRDLSVSTDQASVGTDRQTFSLYLSVFLFVQTFTKSNLKHTIAYNVCVYAKLLCGTI